MKPLNVVCAIILNSAGKILACKRSSKSSLPGKWEFPGGKIELGESAETALRREISEELEVSISILKTLTMVNHLYPNFDFEIALSPFLCEVSDSEIPNAVVHSEISWVNIIQAMELNWADADLLILKQYLNNTKTH
jgi:8-oxo-dGTP diphosphatase